MPAVRGSLFLQEINKADQDLGRNLAGAIWLSNPNSMGRPFLRLDAQASLPTNPQTPAR